MTPSLAPAAPHASPVRALAAGEMARALAEELHASGATVAEIAAALAATAIELMQMATGEDETAGWLADIALAYGGARR